MDKTLAAVFSARLRDAMEGQVMNQNQLAGHLGMTRQGVGGLYNGNVLPSVETLCRLCEILGVSADWLLGLRRRRR